MKIETRAENYTLEEISQMKALNSKLTFQLEDFMYSKKGHPLLLIGDRGSGKTFNVRKVLSNLLDPNYRGLEVLLNYKTTFVKKNKDFKPEEFTPGMFVFKRAEELEFLEPTKLASPEVWGNRLEKYRAKSHNELLKNSNPIIFDDLHYMCENIIEDKLDPKTLTNFLSDVLKEVDVGKNVLIISDDQLSAYAEKIRDEKLDEFLPRFGEIRPSRLHQGKSKSYEELKKYRKEINSVDRMARLIVPLLSYDDFKKLFEASSIKADNSIKYFFYENSSNKSPRTFARFIAEFPDPENVDKESFIEAGKRRIKELNLDEEKKELYLSMTDISFIYSDIDIETFKKIIKDWSYNGLEKYGKEMEKNSPIILEKIIRKVKYFQKTYPHVLNKEIENINKNYRDAKKERYFDILKDWESFEESLRRRKFRLRPIKELKNYYGHVIEAYKILKKVKNNISQEHFNEFWANVPNNYIIIEEEESPKKENYCWMLNEPFKKAFYDLLTEETNFKIEKEDSEFLYISMKY